MEAPRRSTCLTLPQRTPQLFVGSQILMKVGIRSYWIVVPLNISVLQSGQISEEEVWQMGSTMSLASQIHTF
jgi:hypothetical protein